MKRRYVTSLQAAMLAAIAAGILVMSAVPASAAPPRSSVSLTGVGSTFDYPFFQAAFAAYGKSHSVSVNYQPLGSGAGILQFQQKTVDFGATDVPMNPTEQSEAVKAGGSIEQIPVSLGGVSVALNLPGV